MARVVCPRCKRVFEATGPPRCPSCGYGGSSAKPSASPQARRRVWVTGALLAVVVAAVVAAIVVNRAKTPEEDAGASLPLGGVATDEQMRSAVDDLRRLVEAPETLRAWGLEGNVTVSGSPYVFRFQWDPLHQAYDTLYRSPAEEGYHYERRQRGSVINYDDGETVLVGRDERPETLAGRERAGLLPHPLPLEGYVVDSREGANVHGRPATHFLGHNATGPLDFWVYDSDLRLAGAKGQVPRLAFDLRFFYDASVEVAVTTEGERASVRFDKVEAIGFTRGEPQTVWVNGTLDRNHTEEVKLEELDMHATEGPRGAGQIRAVMPVVQGSTPPTHPHYHFEYVDADGDGLASSGDRYQFILKPGAPPAYLSFFDRWSSTYEGGALPGPLAWAAMLAVLGAAWARRGATLGSPLAGPRRVP